MRRFESSSTGRSKPLVVFQTLAGSIGYVIGALALSAGFTMLFVVPSFLILANSITQAEFRDIVLNHQIVIFIGFETVFLGAALIVLLKISIQKNWVSKKAIDLSVPTRSQVIVSLCVALVLAGFSFGLHLIAEATGILVSSPSPMTNDTSMYIYVGYAAAAIFILAPIEELLFRGLIQNYVKPVLGSVGAILWTTLVFTAYHMPTYLVAGLDYALIQFFIIVSLGITLSTFYEYNRNLLQVILIHGIFNILFSMLGLLVL